MFKYFHPIISRKIKNEIKITRYTIIFSLTIVEYEILGFFTSAVFHSTINSIKFLNERTEIDVPRHDSSLCASKINFPQRCTHSFRVNRNYPRHVAEQTWTNSRKSFAESTAEDHRLYGFIYGRAENSKHPKRTNERTRPVMSTDRTRCRCSHHLPCTRRGDTILLRQ